VKTYKWDHNMVLAVGTTVVCVLLLGVVIYSIVSGPENWDRIIVYIAATFFLAVVALIFYTKRVKNT